MTDLLRNPPPGPCVVIDAGLVTASDIETEVGTFRYFCTYVDDEGDLICVFDGLTLNDAMRAATSWECTVIVDRSALH